MWKPQIWAANQSLVPGPSGASDALEYAKDMFDVNYGNWWPNYDSYRAVSGNNAAAGSNHHIAKYKNGKYSQAH